MSRLTVNFLCLDFSRIWYFSKPNTHENPKILKMKTIKHTRLINYHQNSIFRLIEVQRKSAKLYRIILKAFLIVHIIGYIWIIDDP